MENLSRRNEELRRLSAKQGWYDAFDGSGPRPPKKCVMGKNGKPKQNPVPDEEEQAYWDGYDEGLMAEACDENPYAMPPNRGLTAMVR